MLETLIKRALPERMFQRHFHMEHEFHGIIEHTISETFIIRPSTDLGLQLLIDGVHITDPSLHLCSKIMVKDSCIKVQLNVIDPKDSQRILNQLKKTIVKQLCEFETRFYSSPVVQYVEKFCSQCIHHQTKPLNQCISSCRFQAKKQTTQKEKTHA